jgi:hypothetical protein
MPWCQPSVPLASGLIAALPKIFQSSADDVLIYRLLFQDSPADPPDAKELPFSLKDSASS